MQLKIWFHSFSFVFLIFWFFTGAIVIKWSAIDALPSSARKIKKKVNNELKKVTISEQKTAPRFRQHYFHELPFLLGVRANSHHRLIVTRDNFDRETHTDTHTQGTARTSKWNNGISFSLSTSSLRHLFSFSQSFYAFVLFVFFFFAACWSTFSGWHFLADYACPPTYTSFDLFLLKLLVNYFSCISWGPLGRRVVAFCVNRKLTFTKVTDSTTPSQKKNAVAQGVFTFVPDVVRTLPN